MRKYIFILISVSGLIGLLVSPAESLAASQEALTLCINIIIPTLFPFFVFSSLSISLGMADILDKIFKRIMKPVFNVNGYCSTAFILGLISGFPVGAKTAISLYQNGQCSKAEAERLLSFSNNAGPAFILGTVGIGIWNSSYIGWVLWSTQISASIIVGFIFGKLWKNKKTDNIIEFPIKKSKVVRFLPALTDAVKNSAVNLIYISSFIIFFAIVIRLLSVSGIIPATADILSRIINIESLTANDFENIISGIFEFTTGIKHIGNTAPYSQNLTLTAAILGWAGISVHCQVLSFVYESGLSAAPYIIGKALQTIISAIMVFYISKHIPIENSISVFSAYTETINNQTFYGFRILAFSVITIIALTSLILFVLIQKRTNNGTKICFKKKG